MKDFRGLEFSICLNQREIIHSIEKQYINFCTCIQILLDTLDFLLSADTEAFDKPQICLSAHAHLLNLLDKALIA